MFLLSLRAISQTAFTDWEPGYIIFNGQTDTLKGYIHIKRSNIGYLKNVKFRKTMESKKEMINFSNYPKDTLSFFGTTHKNYKFVNFMDKTLWVQPVNSIEGWVEVISKGAINICKGFSITRKTFQYGYPSGPLIQGSSNGPTTQGSFNSPTMQGSRKVYTPVYILNKDYTTSIIIAGTEVTIFNGNDISRYHIDHSYKNHLATILEDNPELKAKIRVDNLLFGDVEKIILEYNQWAKQAKATN
jgi:hypothetical protein